MTGPHVHAPPPRISVIVPTYQRRELVVAAVRALVRQSFGKPFEVVVVVDGSTDGSADALRQLSVPFPLVVLEQPNRGAAEARNLGARRARGEILLFLDDDMAADPRLLEVHERGHRQGADAVLGHMPLHRDSVPGVISDAVAGWSEERRVRLSRSDAVLTLHDMLTGQLSVSADVFRAIGGFDASFTRDGSFGNEDVDLGHRLLRDGYHVRFDPEAVSHQRYVVTPRQHLRQWRQAGRADVTFARKHPEDAAELFVLNGLRTPLARWLARPLAGVPMWELVTAPARSLAAVLGSRRGRISAAAFFAVRALEYWRGVREAGGIPRHTVLRVLAYHAISDLRGHGLLEPYGVPLEDFRRQVAVLTAHGFHLITPREFAAFAEGRAGLPRRAVLLTFDDCYTDLREAGEALDGAGAGAGALAFAVSGLLGGENDWDRHHGGPPLRLLDAAGLRQLRTRGIEVGAHSRTHAVLPACSPEDLEAEIRGCVADLEAARLGPIRFFAYPYGEHDARTRGVVRDSGMAAAFAIDPGVMDGRTDRMQIPRIEILRSDRGARFLLKVRFARQAGWMRPRTRRIRALAVRAGGRLRRFRRRGEPSPLSSGSASSPAVDGPRAGRPT